jgi:VWFA-related protein
VRLAPQTVSQPFVVSAFRRTAAVGKPLLVLATALAGPWLPAQQPPRFTERVDVPRIILDARVIDDRGDPVLGLDAGDFRVRIDGKPARVETATWVGGVDMERRALPSGAPAQATPPRGRSGRLVVFLFQKDLEPSRIVGLLRMLLKSRDFLDTLGPNDRVAILSFDSYLKVWTDFTNDREVLDRVLAHGVLFERPPILEASGTPSLVRGLDPRRSRRTYTIEGALEAIGGALAPFDGSKSLVLVGHGFGRLSRGRVDMENEYGPARHALVASRTAVFSLDVTEADYHSLEAGLELVAEQTGGFYARTHIFPDNAVRRLSGALAGYYVLFVEEPSARRGVHDVQVDLRHRKGRVLATTSYTDRVR